MDEVFVDKQVERGRALTPGLASYLSMWTDLVAHTSGFVLSTMEIPSFEFSKRHPVHTRAICSSH
jgi:hypothetical protein